jgi:hypothetical protein
MPMKTSSFKLYTGPGRISIARRAPMHTPPGFRVAKFLAPGPWFMSVSKEEYERLFRAEILGVLDPRQTWERLHDMAAGHEPVLLCWEELKKPREWCHRTLVADWIKETVGEVVEEWAPPKVQESLL